MKWERLPVVVDALEWDGVDLSATAAFLKREGPDAAELLADDVVNGRLMLETAEGQVRVLPGDYIFRSDGGGIHVLQREVFLAAYKPAIVTEARSEQTVDTGKLTVFGSIAIEPDCSILASEAVERAFSELRPQLIAEIAKVRALMGIKTRNQV